MPGSVDPSSSGGVDWSGKTPNLTTATGKNSSLLSVSGTGYILNVAVSPFTDDSYGAVEVSIDENVELTQDLAPAYGAIRYGSGSSGIDSGWLLVGGPIRFESSFDITETGDVDTAVEVTYVLD